MIWCSISVYLLLLKDNLNVFLRTCVEKFELSESSLFEISDLEDLRARTVDDTDPTTPPTSAADIMQQHHHMNSSSSSQLMDTFQCSNGNSRSRSSTTLPMVATTAAAAENLKRLKRVSSNTHTHTHTHTYIYIFISRTFVVVFVHLDSYFRYISIYTYTHKVDSLWLLMRRQQPVNKI